MSWLKTSGPSTLEKVIAGLCYLTSGLAGLLFIIINGQSRQSEFFRFHFLQSIILGIIALIFSWCSGVFTQIFFGILSALTPALGEAAPTIAKVISMAMVVVQNAFYLLILYATVWAFIGKKAEIPFISPIVWRRM
jgi:uncharacterized membrane protein